MSGKIYGAITEHFIRRMRNWALTHAGCIGAQRVISSAYLAGPRDTYDDAPAPILRGEARDVDRALVELPIRYRQAVMLFWQYEGRPLAWFARRQGVGIDWRTFERRVIEGHERLQAELARQHATLERFRAAVPAQIS